MGVAASASAASVAHSNKFEDFGRGLSSTGSTDFLDFRLFELCLFLLFRSFSSDLSLDRVLCRGFVDCRFDLFQEKVKNVNRYVF